MDEEGKADKGTTGEGPQPTGLAAIFGSFERTFWVVNGFELFERGAYYSTMAVLGVHVVLNLLADDPMASALWGSLYSFLVVLLYFLPLLAAALADKFGYKNMLVMAFSSMLIGYTALSFVRPGQLGLLVAAFFMVGVGAGFFKPIISATIAHVTPTEKRNLAYSIYYWMINLGAVVFPLSVGLIFRDSSIYNLVFLLSSSLVVVNLVILFLLFRSPVPPQPDLKVSTALARIVPALRDRWFVLLLVIYAGFWFMFAYNHTFLPVMMVQFARMPAWFTPPFLAVINPLTIVILGPYLGKLVEKRKSLNVMMFGMVIFCIGFAMNGLSDTRFFFVAGIFLFSIGEFIVHPGFISYVSKIAPKDKVAIYLACIFVSTGLGQLVGGFVHGFSYNAFAVGQHRPQLYIATVVTVGLLTLVAFMWYNRMQIKDIMRKDPTAVEDKGVWTKPTTMLVALMFIPITFWGAWAAGPLPFTGESPDGNTSTDWSEYDIMTDVAATETGRTAENGGSDLLVDVANPNVRSITFSLTWLDEAASGPRYTNEPDAFGLEVLPPQGDAEVTSMSTSGRVTLTILYSPTEDPYLNGTGAFAVTVVCGNCGNQVPIINFLGLREIEDDGNSWSLDVTYEYYAKAEA